VEICESDRLDGAAALYLRDFEGQRVARGMWRRDGWQARWLWPVLGGVVVAFVTTLLMRYVR
jgi:hypothetical protein